MKALVIISLILLCCFGVKASKEVAAPTTIVQSNHFSSNEVRNAHYDIQNVQLNKPLILMLKGKRIGPGPDYKLKHEIEITLKAGGEDVKCMFQHSYDLCVLKEVKTTDMTMDIACKDLPCQVSWIIYQPMLHTADLTSTTTKAQDFYTLPESENHLIAIVSNSDPKVTTLDSSILYSTSPYIRAYRDNALYFLFTSSKPGYMFLEVSREIRPSTMLTFYKVPAMITYNPKQEIRDYMTKESPSRFAIPSPTDDFRIDCSIHGMDKGKEMKGEGFQIKVTGEKNGKQQTIIKQNISISALKSYEFSYVFKQQAMKDYKNLQFQFTPKEQSLIINFMLEQAGVHQVSIGQTSYFSLAKSQKIKFKLIAESQSPPQDKVYFFPSPKDHLKVTPTECSAKNGCQFQLTALEDVKGSIYLGGNKDEQVTEIGQIKEIKAEFISFQTSVTKKIREGEAVYLKKALTVGKAFQLILNSPNAIAYLSTKCDVPSGQCHQHVLSTHSPLIYIPQSQDTLRFTLLGLDNCQFTLRAIQQYDGIEIKLGQPFSYVMDEGEDKVVLRLKLDKKEDVGFDLVAPIHTLSLLINNNKTQPDMESPDLSLDGYLFYASNQQNSLDFTILIKKIIPAAYAHFTFIATTSSTPLRLQAAVPHYSTIPAGGQVLYLFQNQPDKDFILNLYSYNLKDQKVAMEMMLNNQKEWKGVGSGGKVKKFIIDRPVDMLDLNQPADQLCEDKGVRECEIFIRIVNTMDIEVDLTSTLMVRDAVIELKDGIWQSFAGNLLANTAHFYFFIRSSTSSSSNADKGKSKSDKSNSPNSHPVTLSYTSTSPDIRIAYSLWQSDSTSLNPARWPFPAVPTTPPTSKPLKYITLDSGQLKCAPNCVMLISLYRTSNKQLPPGDKGVISVMASNSRIQLPEKQKMQLVLKNQQQKLILVDLKYALEKQNIVFFTSSMMGNTVVTATVSSSRTPRCPSSQIKPDFTFYPLQTLIPISSIKAHLQQNQMQQDNDLYLCLLLKSHTDSKLTIEYDTDGGEIKKLQMDTFEVVELPTASTTKMYQITGFTDFNVKIVRKRGFPFVFIKKCSKEEDYQSCIEKFKSSPQKGKQLLTKTQQFLQPPCPTCLFLFKFTTQQPSEVVFHLQSKNSEIQLKENELMPDFINENEENKYLITAVRQEEVVVTIDVSEGQVNATLTDYSSVNLTKSSSTSKLIHFVIPPANANKQTQAPTLGKSVVSQFALSSTFTSYHLIVTSTKANVAAAFTVIYSSGAREVYLQDGLVVSHGLDQGKKVIFYYINQQHTGHVYLTLGADTASNLNQLKIKGYSVEDWEKRDLKGEKTQFAIQRPPMRKKTPNPTLLLSLPTHPYYIIEITSPTALSLTISINHQQVILLTYQHPYPFLLHAGEDISFLVDVNIVGYLRIGIKKCDQGQPQFGYSFDYDQFIKGELSYETELNDEPRFDYTVKANQIGTFYMKFVAPQDKSALLSLNVQHFTTKPSPITLKAGNSGVLQYQLLDSSSAQITFGSAICTQKDCASKAKYFMMSSQNVNELYTQMVCKNEFFAIEEGLSSTTPLQLKKLDLTHPKTQSNLTFTYAFPSHISYIAIKCVYTDASGAVTQTLYHPLQIATIWGQLSRTSHGHKLTILAVIILGIIGMLVLVRRKSRDPRYRPLQQQRQ